MILATFIRTKVNLDTKRSRIVLVILCEAVIFYQYSFSNDNELSGGDIKVTRFYWTDEMKYRPEKYNVSREIVQ